MVDASKQGQVWPVFSAFLPGFPLSGGACSIKDRHSRSPLRMDGALEDPMGECPHFTILRQTILEGILPASQHIGKRRAVKHICFCLLSTNWPPLLRALQLVSCDPLPSRPAIHKLPKEKVYTHPSTHTHNTHTSPVPISQEKSSDWPVLGQITSLNPHKHDVEPGSRHPTGLQAPLHSAGEGTGYHCDLVRYYNESIVSVP